MSSDGINETPRRRDRGPHAPPGGETRARVGRRLASSLLLATTIALGGDPARAVEAEAEMRGDGPTEIGQGGRDRVEEIVVQARKREELLENTPVAVTAISAETLREAGVYRIDGLRELVPNLQFSGQLLGGQAQFSIRGVGTGSPDIQFDPGVAVYLDGVFLPRSFGSLLDVVDVQQIEVLRGPQGTLFGKNSVGGAINITTVKPRPELEGFVLLRPGNLNSIETEMMLNMPLIEDRLFSRIAFFSSNRSGYVFDRFRDEDWSNRSNLSFLGSLRLLATDDLTLDLSGTYSRAQSYSRGGQCLVVRPDVPLARLLPQGFFDACAATTPFEMTADTASLVDNRSWGTWGTATWDAGDVGPIEGLIVKARGAWTRQTPRFRAEVDYTLFPIVAQSTAGGGVADGAPGHQQQISSELQVNGAAFGGRLNFVGGFFAFWESGSETRSTDVGFIGSVSGNYTQISNWTYAPYVQATGDITDWLALTAGVRYTADHKGLILDQYDPTTGVYAVRNAKGSETFTRVTPMASIAATLPADHLPDSLDHLMGYFTYAQGFKGGGFNALPGSSQDAANTLGAPFGQEILDNFELGAKAIALDDRLTVNLALFWGIYDDIQKVSVVTTGIDDMGVPIVERVTQNAASATIRGFEIETQAYPMSGLQLTASAGYTDAVYDDFPNAISDFDDSEPINRAGETFNNVPRLQTFVSAQYSFAIESDGPEILDGWLTPRVEWYYQSAVHLLGPEVPATNQPGYNLVNVRLSYDFWDDRAQVALWSKNIADQTYADFATPIVTTFGTAVKYFNPPRTYGAELSFRF